VASLFPLDAQLNLPAQGYSHRLQQRVARQAAKESFEEVVKDIEAETGVHLGKRQVEEIVATAAHDFEAFYVQPLPEELQRQAQSKPIQVLTFDGKGVVMRPEACGKEPARKLKPVHRGRPAVFPPRQGEPQTNGDGSGYLSP